METEHPYLRARGAPIHISAGKSGSTTGGADNPWKKINWQRPADGLVKSEFRPAGHSFLVQEAHQIRRDERTKAVRNNYDVVVRRKATLSAARMDVTQQRGIPLCHHGAWSRIGRSSPQ